MCIRDRSSASSSSRSTLQAVAVETPLWSSMGASSFTSAPMMFALVTVRMAPSLSLIHIWYDFLTVKVDGGGGEHSHILQAAHMVQVALAKGHKKADALDVWQVLAQRFNFLVVQQVHILLTRSEEHTSELQSQR